LTALPFELVHAELYLLVCATGGHGNHHISDHLSRKPGLWQRVMRMGVSRERTNAIA
jgi:hypothetical protein